MNYARLKGRLLRTYADGERVLRVTAVHATSKTLRSLTCHGPTYAGTRNGRILVRWTGTRYHIRGPYALSHGLVLFRKKWLTLTEFLCPTPRPSSRTASPGASATTSRPLRGP